jgi:hypothetical protein
VVTNRLVSVAILLAPIVAGAATRFTSASSPALSWTAVRDTTGCLDTLQASDSVSAVVTMSVRPQDPKTTLPRDFEGLFVQETKSRLRVPQTLLMVVMTGWNQCDSASRCVGGVPMLGINAYAIAQPTGELSRIGVIDASLTPAFTDSVRKVFEKIGLEKMSPPFFDRKDSIPLKISIGVQQDSDSVPPHRRLFRVNLPHYNLPYTPADWTKTPKGPKYPSIAETRGIGDSVTVRFTILADGSVAARSVDVEAGRYINFIQSVFDWLGTVRYRPAHLGACPVASRASQSFMFKTR